jgi:hypothetical protein
VRKFGLVVTVIAAVALGVGVAAMAYTKPFMGFSSSSYSTDEDSGTLWVKLKNSPKNAYQHGLLWTTDGTANGAGNCGANDGSRDFIQITQNESRLVTANHVGSVLTPITTCSDPTVEANPEWFGLHWNVVQIVGQPTSHNGRTSATGYLYD